MKKAFLEFMGYVINGDCPFYNFNVSTYKTFIDVVFIVETSVRPQDLGWLNTHLVGGKWFVIAEGSSIRLVVRFNNTEDD